MTTLIPKYDQGATGAVNRPINLKLAETISVKDFGVVGDGSDEHVAVQNALNAIATSNIKTLDFCGLTITINQTVYVPSGAKLKGNNATIKCSTTSFTNDGNLQGLTALIANKNANITDGSAKDYDIEISGFNFIAGSNVAMDGVYLANTVNAYVHDNSFTYQQAAQYAHLVDCHHTNTNALIEHNRFYHVSTTIVNGACIAFRNSSSLIPSNGLIARSNYMYKNGTSNTDEFMWVNGSTGVISNCKILNNNFVSGSTDATRSVLTIYPYTDGGTITTSEVIGTLIDGNTFTHGNTVSYVILVGYSGESRPAQGVIISNNVFNISSITAIKTITASKGLLINGNLCIVLSGQRAATFFSSDSSYFGAETAKCYNNTLVGLYNIAFLGGYATNNYCQECNYFAYNTRSVVGNIVDTIHYNGAYIEASVSYVNIEDNQFTMDSVNTSIGSLPYAVYTQAFNTVIQDNIVTFVNNGFYTLRTANNSTYAASVYFSRNKLFKNGATDTPAFQSFGYPLGASDNNWLFDRNSSTTPSSGYNVSGFVPATGHVNMYDNISAGSGITIGTVNSTTGVRNIVTTVT